MAVSKIPFRTAYNHHIVVCHNPGRDKRTEYKQVIKDGKPTVVVAGETDIPSLINSFLPDVDLYSILDRFHMENSNINQVVETLRSLQPSMFSYEPVFADLSTVPSNIHELSKIYHNLESFFTSLPAEVRQEYKNSTDLFVANFDSFIKKYSAPAKSESAKAEPAKAEPAKAEPVKSGQLPGQMSVEEV